MPICLVCLCFKCLQRGKQLPCPVRHGSIMWLARIHLSEVFTLVDAVGACSSQSIQQTLVNVPSGDGIQCLLPVAGASTSVGPTIRCFICGPSLLLLRSIRIQASDHGEQHSSWPTSHASVFAMCLQLGSQSLVSTAQISAAGSIPASAMLGLTQVPVQWLDQTVAVHKGLETNSHAGLSRQHEQQRCCGWRRWAAHCCWSSWPAQDKARLKGWASAHATEPCSYRGALTRDQAHLACCLPPAWLAALAQVSESGNCMYVRLSCAAHICLLPMGVHLRGLRL